MARRRPPVAICDDSAAARDDLAARAPAGAYIEEVNTDAVSGATARRAWTLAFVVWSALAALSALQTALYVEQHGGTVDWRSLLVGRALDWYTCLAIAPVFLWILGRFAFAAGRHALAAALVVASAAVFVPVKYAVLSPLLRVFAPGAMPRTIRAELVANFFTEMLFLLGIALAVYAIELYRRSQQSRVEESRLARELSQARLDALTLQLRPHFLFNTLNAAIALVSRDPGAAENMLTDLSELLHATLRDESPHEIALARELEILALYLRIMHHRFGDRLQTEVVADVQARRARVPSFVLQPLVENALQHGVARREGPGWVRVTARVTGDRLEIEVRDAGDGASPNGNARGESGIGLGLTNTRHRLEALFGDDFTLTMTTGDGDTSVRLEIPYRAA